MVNFSFAIGRNKYRLQACVKDKLPSIQVDGLSRVTKYLNTSSKIKLNLPKVEQDLIDDLDLLIGADHYGKLVVGQTRRKGIDLLLTPNGAVVYGKIPNAFCRKKVSQNVAIVSKFAVKDSFHHTLIKV